MTGTAALRAHRSALFAGTAAATSVALALLSTPAAAQGLNGTPTVTSGYATITPDNTDITVFSGETTIDWRTTGNAGDTNVEFLSAGSSVTFHDYAGSSSGDFTVLNRVFPQYLDSVTNELVDLNATISLAGTVNSNANNASGGRIWFYSPHGIVTNGSATFNVGSLLLTTSDIQTDQFGYLHLDGYNGTQIGFQSATDPNGVVQIGAGTTINATGFDQSPVSAYVGVFAPRIEQGGTIRSDGMTALVAASAGTITFNAGLIDIQVTEGTDESQHNGIVHTGTTGGPASGGETRQIQLVAIPKNTALTMLLGGSIGYDAATASSDGSAVVLSAGRTSTTPQSELALGLGNMKIGNTLIGNRADIYATGTLDVLPQFVSTTQPGLVRFGGYTQLYVGKALNLTAGAGEQIDALDSLYASPLVDLAAFDAAITVTGNPSISPQAGKITVANVLGIDASARELSFQQLTPDTGLDATGGRITLAVDRGTLSAGDRIDLFNHGVGQDGAFAGGAGTGGITTVSVSGGGAITTTALRASADGAGGYAFADSSAGGRGSGGRITLTDNGGSLDLGTVGLEALGYGAYGLGSSGDGVGGKIAVSITGGAQSWFELAADASSFAAGDQGGGSGSATGQAGGVSLSITGPGKLDTQYLSLTNNAYVPGAGAVAASGTAGGIDLAVNAGGTLSVTQFATLEAYAGAPPESYIGNGAYAPAMTGGQIAVTVTGAGSTLTANALQLAADADGFGAATTGANATGGQASVGVLNGGKLVISGTDPALTVQAVGRGGFGPAPSDGVGGTARVYAQGGTIDAGTTAIKVSAAALAGGFGFDGQNQGSGATGGTAAIELLSGGSGTNSMIAGDLVITAKGEATALIEPDPFTDIPAVTDGNNVGFFQGDGRTGKGGTARLVVQSGSLAASGAITVHADGLGGAAGFAFDSSTPYQSGDGVGGTALLTQSGGTITAASVDLSAAGRGGGYAAAGGSVELPPLAGSGLGGTARATLSGGTLTTPGQFAIVTAAVGGVGASTTDSFLTPGDGGSAHNSAGLAELLMPAGSTALLGAGNLLIVADAVGGAGGINSATGAVGAGGSALSGTARAALADGGFNIATSVEILAGPLGGAGSVGGNAVGGAARFALSDTLAAPSTTRNIGGTLTLSASPIGGAGSTAAGIATAGQTQLAVAAGRAASALTVQGDLVADALGDIAPAGDGFTATLGAVPVKVGGNLTVRTDRDISGTIAAGGGFDVTGAVSLLGRAINVTGLGIIRSGGDFQATGRSGIALGGVASGATTLIEAVDPDTLLRGPVTVTSLTSAGAVTVRGSTVTIGSPGALTFAQASASTGPLSITTAGDLTMGGSSAAGPVSLASGGNLLLSGTLSGSAVALQAAGDILVQNNVTTLSTLSALAGGRFVSTLGLAVPGATSIDAAGGITLPALSSGGTTLLRATSGAVQLPSLASTGAVTLVAASATVAGSGPLTIASATTTGDLSLSSSGNLAIAAANVGGAARLVATGGALTATNLAATGPVTASGSTVAIAGTGPLAFTSATSTAGPLSINSTGNLSLTQVTSAGAATLSSGGALLVSDIAVAGAVNVTGGSVDLRSSGPLAVASAVATAGPLAVTSQGNLQVATASATGTAALTSTTGTLTTTGALSGNGVSLSAPGAIQLGGAVNAGSGAFAVTTPAQFLATAPITAGSADLRTGAITLGNLSTTGAISMTSAGLITLTGAVEGGTITLRSPDLALGATARLGRRGLTSAITLVNTAPTAGTFIGGTGQANAWSLSGAEAARIFADQALTITTGTAASPADVVLGSLALSYGPATSGANLGSGATFAVTTTGRIAVTGNVALTTSSAADTLALTAGSGSTIDVVTDTGSLVMGSNGVPGGTLRLSAGGVRVATARAFADLPGLTTTAAITQRLDANDGLVNAAGALQAGTIAVSVADRFLVQNSGTGTGFAQRRGFTANALGIQASSPSAVIAINGVLLGAAGTSLAGTATLREITINGVLAGRGGGFDFGSTVNGCIIRGSCDVAPGQIAPPGDTIRALTAPITPGGGPAALLNLPVISFGELPLLDSPPLIDEPVTGVGNDDLWERR